jgi:hypothetical protein
MSRIQRNWLKSFLMSQRDTFDEFPNSEIGWGSRKLDGRLRAQSSCSWNSTPTTANGRLEPLRERQLLRRASRMAHPFCSRIGRNDPEELIEQSKPHVGTKPYSCRPLSGEWRDDRILILATAILFSRMFIPWVGCVVKAGPSVSFKFASKGSSIG